MDKTNSEIPNDFPTTPPPGIDSTAKPVEKTQPYNSKRGFLGRGKFIPPAAAQPTQPDSDIAALKEKAALADKYRDQIVRLQADFENFRKRINREREENAQAALEGTLKKLVPLLDDFERALATNPKDANPAAVEGVNLVFQKLRATLIELGLEEISALGQVFNPHLHEAIAQFYSEQQPEGTVIEQARKGYKIGQRLLRPASVVVSKGKATEDLSGE